MMPCVLRAMKRGICESTPNPLRLQLTVSGRDPTPVGSEEKAQHRKWTDTFSAWCVMRVLIILVCFVGSGLLWLPLEFTEEYGQGGARVFHKFGVLGYRIKDEAIWDGSYDPCLQCEGYVNSLPKLRDDFYPDQLRNTVLVTLALLAFAAVGCRYTSCGFSCYILRGPDKTPRYSNKSRLGVVVLTIHTVIRNGHD